MGILSLRHTRSLLPRRAFVGLAVAMALACLAAALSARPAHAQGAEPDELKAAFVFQFANFVEWPESTYTEDDDPFTICVIGNDRVAETLRGAVANRTVSNRQVEIRTHVPTDEDASCQIVFIDKRQEEETQEQIDRVMTSPVLTVSDAEDFTKDGGIIRLYEERNRLRIEINVDAAERAGLTISSKLLGLARVVRDEAQGDT